MRRRSGLVAGALLVTGTMLAAAGWFGPNLLRGEIAAAASRSLGRPVTIRALHLAPAWPPLIVADGLASEGLGSIDTVTLRLDGAAIWQGRIQAASARATGVAMRLETDATGLRSPLPPRRPQGPSAAAGRSVQAVAGQASGPASVRVQIEDARVTWHDPRLGSDVVILAAGVIQTGAGYDVALTFELPRPAIEAGLSRLTVRARRVAGNAPDLEVHGTFRGEDFSGAAAGIPLPAVLGSPLGSTAARPLVASVRIAGAAIEARGTLPAGPSPSFVGHVSARADDFARLAPLLRLAAAPSGPVTVEADVSADGTQVQLRRASIEAPMLAGTGEGSWRAGDPPIVSARLALRRLDLDSIPRLAPAPAPASPSPPTVAAQLGPQPTSDRTLPWGALARIDGDLELTVDGLDLRGAEYRDAAATISLRDGTLIAQPVAATVPPGSRIDGSLRLASRAGSDSALVLHAPNLEMGPLLRALDLPPVLDGPAAIDADLHATGATPRALAASLDGHATLHMAAGAIDARLLDAVLGAAHLPVPHLGGQAKLRCLDFGLQAHQGVVSVGSLAVDTEALRVDGGGTVDLGSEAVDLTLHPLLRIGPGLTVPVHVGGTLRQPAIKLGGGEGAPAVPPGAACPDAPGERAKPPKLLDFLRHLP